MVKVKRTQRHGPFDDIWTRPRDRFESFDCRYFFTRNATVEASETFATAPTEEEEEKSF